VKLNDFIQAGQEAILQIAQSFCRLG